MSGLLTAPVLLLVCGSFVDGLIFNSREHFSPQIAMLCDRDATYHNQYLDRVGHWVSDLQFTGGCLRSPNDILNFCRRVYPDLNVARIQQADEASLIDTWCKVDLGQCSESVWVRPYRCLSHEEAEASPASTAARTCHSDQVSNASHCWDKVQWRLEAVKACQTRAMTLTSLFPVYPCGADVFTGVDFECCPSNEVPDKENADSMDLFDDLDVEDDENDDEDDDIEEENEEAEDIDEEIEDIEADILDNSNRDQYYTKFDPRVEHAAFKEAMGRLEGAYRKKSAKIMDEWNELEKRYQTLKEADDTKAEEFKLKMTDRFQRLVNALKSRDSSEKGRLRSLHQQRMTAHVDNLKRDSMACYNRSLSAPTPAPATVHRCLSKLLRALYRDRHHTISHFQHLRATQPKEADVERFSTAKHIQYIQDTIDQSIQRLDRFPQVKFMIFPDVTQLLGGLQRRDSVPVELEHQEITDIDIIETTPTSTTTTSTTTTTTTAPPEQRATSELEAGPAATAAPPHLSAVDLQPQPVSVESVSIEVHASPALRRLEPLVVHSQPLALSHRGGMRHNEGYGRGFYLSVGLTALAMVVAVVAGVMAVRRRHSPQNHGFIEVEQPAHGGEVHLDHLQVNGYENPTYKYFDK